MRANVLQSRWALGAWVMIGMVVLSVEAKEPASQDPSNKETAAKDGGIKETKIAPPRDVIRAAPVKAGPVIVAKASAPSGRELFTREWLPNDTRAHGGDGLGPVYNDTSCVACHNQGGIGGGGAANKNVDIISG